MGLWAKSFAYLKTDICQDINDSFSFSTVGKMALNHKLQCGAQRTQILCGEVKFNIITTSKNVLRLWEYFWRPLEAINGQRMQK